MAAATTTELEVCNLALLLVGNGQQINGFDEKTMESKACKVFYAKARDAFLEAFWWKFATKRALLAVVAGQTRDGWAYVYAQPSDFLAPQRIWNGERVPTARNKIPFTLEGTFVLTDRAQASLIYTYQCTAVALWTPLAIDALGWELAMRLALILPVRKDWAKDAKQEAALAFTRAVAANLRAEQEDPEPPSEYTSER